MPGAVASRHLASSRATPSSSLSLSSLSLSLSLSLFVLRRLPAVIPRPRVHVAVRVRIGIRQAAGKRVSIARAPPPFPLYQPRVLGAELTRSPDLGAARAEAIGTSVTRRRLVFMIPPRSLASSCTR